MCEKVFIVCLISIYIDLDEKIEIFKKAGGEAVFIISDFDATLTYAFNSDGTQASNSISVFRNGGYLGSEYVEKSKALAKHYHAIETNSSLDLEFRKEMMVEWWEKHFDLLREYGITKEIIEKVANGELLHFREGLENFLNIIFSNNVPLMIFSGGVGDVIRLSLKKLNKLTTNVSIISNLWKYDIDGKFEGVEGEIIHSLNKGLVSVDFSNLKNRRNVILIGDSLGDLGMVNGFKYDNIITVGYFNKKKSDVDYKDARRKYLENFDLVVEEDGTLDPVTGLLRKILI